RADRPGPSMIRSGRYAPVRPARQLPKEVVKGKKWFERRALRLRHRAAQCGAHHVRVIRATLQAVAGTFPIRVPAGRMRTELYHRGFEFQVRDRVRLHGDRAPLPGRNTAKKCQGSTLRMAEGQVNTNCKKNS